METSISGYSLFQYPVVGIDGWCPVTNPVSGEECGMLDILLAVGSYEQVTSTFNTTRYSILIYYMCSSIFWSSSDAWERVIWLKKRSRPHVVSVVTHRWMCLLVEGLPLYPALSLDVTMRVSDLDLVAWPLFASLCCGRIWMHGALPHCHSGQPVPCDIW